jgi:hypothetical protein
LSWVTLLRASGVPVFTREQWGAQYRYSANTMGKPKYAFLHITVTNPTGNIAADSRTVERIGIQRFPNTGISYTALVHRGGTVCIGQPDGRRGAHTLNDKGIAGFPHNLNAYGDAISFVANVQHPFGEKEAEAVARYFASRQLAGIANYDGTIRMHRDFAWKDCPGSKAAAWIKYINQKYDEYVKAGRLPGGTAPTPGEEEFILRAEDKADFQQWVANGVLQGLQTSSALRNEIAEIVEAMLQKERGEYGGGSTNKVKLADGGANRYAWRAYLEALELKAQLGALSNVVAQLASGDNLSVEDIKAAAKAGADEALNERITDADVHLEVAPADNK